LDGLSFMEIEGETYTKCHLTLDPVSSTFWVSK